MEFRQRQGEDGEIGAHFGGQRDGLAAGARLGDDPPAGLRLQEPAQATADHLVLVGQHDPEHGARSSAGRPRGTGAPAFAGALRPRGIAHAL